MELTVYENANDFLAAAAPLLEQNEAANNLILGIAERLTHNPHYYGQEDPFLAVVSDGGPPLLVALRTPPYGLALYAPEDDPAEAIKTLIRHLADGGTVLPGVNGPAALSENFARRWSRRTGAPYRLKMRERVYELRQVIPPRPVDGAMHPAGAADMDLIAQWTYGFHDDAFGPGEMDEAEARKVAERSLATGGLHFWEVDGQPVSMALLGRKTRHGIVVGLVYTPPEQRGRGFASALVAALSQKALDEGYEFAALFTNLDYPTSNHIYMEIGYRPLADYLHFEFGPAEVC